jgi:(p)ppGpp synthase/HD superfamily hydrolase
MATLDAAIGLAVEKHRGVLDRAGEPYILHPLRVMMRVRELGGSVEAQMVAVLHDVMEDCGVTSADLRALGFSEAVVSGVESVTKRADEEGAEQYQRFVERAAQHPLGRLVKRADLEDNLDVRRNAELTEKDRLRLNRYLRAWRYLVKEQ